ncbi:MAG: hypothetical protein AB9866_07875 [Syntrophobacteraceae bacterium]
MKRSLLLLAFLGTVLLSTASALGDGDFYVIAGGSGVGTKITSAPYTISAPGFYYLGTNLSGRIIIESSNVTLDLMGFTMTGSGTGSGTGVTISGVLKNIEVRNGTIRNFVDGIGAYFVDPPEMCHRIINVRVLDNTEKGIYLAGSGHLIKGCTAYGNSVGIYCSNSLLVHNVSTLNSASNISGAGNTLVDNRF